MNEEVHGRSTSTSASESLSSKWAMGVWAMGFWALSLAPSCVSLVWYGHSPDRRQHVRVIEKHGTQHVRRNGRAGSRYGAIGIEALTFSPDSRHLAYPARCRCGDHWFVVLGGREGRCWQGIGEIRFSPDSRHLAFVAQRHKKWHVVRDGQIDPPVDAVYKKTLRWSPDSRHLAYVAQRGGAKHVVVNGKVGPSFDRIAHLTFAAQGRVVYLAQRRGAWFAVVNHQRSRPYQGVAGLIVSRDGAHLAYAAQLGSKARVVLDGREQPLYDAVRFQTLRFTDDGRLLYIARQGKRYRIIFGARQHPLYDAIEPPVTRGGSWGYVARSGRKHLVVIDGKVRHGPVRARWLGDLTFSPDGRHHAYITQHGATAAVHHKGRASTFDLVVMGTLVFSRDSRHWACLAGNRAKKQLFISVDGKQRRPFDSTELTAEIMRRGNARPALIRRWVAAELELALSPRTPKGN